MAGSAVLLGPAGPSWANNIAVANVELKAPDALNDYTHVEFDLSWDNSWKTSSAPPNNWDAAWVFAKFRKPATSGNWAHCTLNGTGHTAPSGSIITVPSDGKGALIYRSGDGTGSNNWLDARLRWNYGADGVVDSDNVDIRVFAIEMVYVPGGAFYAGDTTSGVKEGSADTDPWNVTSAGAISVTNATSDGYYYVSAGNSGEDATGSTFTIPAAFPNGYGAFYLMKYEVSQGQYADFLSTLTDTQDDTRYPNQNGSYRHTISGSYGSYSASVPDRACNSLSWADGAAYADWAGLRPMTELEYEKAARGPTAAVAEEYAWGTTTIAGSAYTLANDGTATENISANYDANGNAFYSTTNGNIDGPLRCGIFATGSSTRATAGAGYYGAMELSGNMWERPVTVGNATGRAFDGGHGDGALDATGNVNVTNWPGTTASGAGFRGGGWSSAAAYLRVSYRSIAAGTFAGRGSDDIGFRCARSAP